MNPLKPMNRVSHQEYFCHHLKPVWGKLSVIFEINWSNFRLSLFVCNESNGGATTQWTKASFQSLNLALKGRCSNIHNSWLFRRLNAFYQFSKILFLAKLAKRVSTIFSANFSCDTENQKSIHMTREICTVDVMPNPKSNTAKKFFTSLFKFHTP